MMQRSIRARSNSANDNVAPSDRIGPRTLPIVGFFALVLLSGAFLVGLAVVGLLAAAVSGFELIRRHFGRKPLGAFDQQVVG